MDSERVWIVTFLASVILAGSISAFGQKITGDISGSVADSSGALIPNASVSAVNINTNFTRNVTTSGSGLYQIPDLAVGTYKVTASRAGFTTQVRQVAVSANAVSGADFVLQVGQSSQVVDVSGEAPLIDLSSNDNNYVENSLIDALPVNGRDFNSLVALTPGVQRNPGGGFLAVSANGARTTSNNYMIDGLYNNDRYYGDSAINQSGLLGIPATLFPPEATAELGIQGTPSAEFGVKGGSAISLVMKSGTNNWHGTAEWFRHTAFGDAANYFSNGNGCSTDCVTPIHNNQFGGTIGGPIVKDRLFFFLYYEGQRNDSVAPSVGFVPTPAQISAATARITAADLSPTTAGENLLAFFPASTTGTLTVNTPALANSDNFGFKIDYNVSKNHTISGRYIFGNSLQEALPLTFAPVAPLNNPTIFDSTAPARAQLLGLSWIWLISPNKTMESRFGVTRFSEVLGVNNKINPESLGIDTGPLLPSNYGVPYAVMSAFSTIGGVAGYPLPTQPDETYDWSEHLTWTSGNHGIRIGGNFQHAYSSVAPVAQRTSLFFDGTNFGGNPVDELVQLLLARPDGATRFFGNPDRLISQNSIGLYYEDNWKIRPRLTITYGLRYDLFGSIGEQSDLASTFFPNQGLVQVGHGIGSLWKLDKKDLGPRLGFAWDALGKGKLAVRGGYALTYDVPNMATFASPYSFARSTVGTFTQPDLGIFQATLSANAANPPEFGSCSNPNTGVVGDYICIPNGPIFGSSPTGAPPFNAFSVVSPFKTPRSNIFNLSIQDELFKNNTVTVAYVGTRGEDLVIFRDLNASPVGCNLTNDCVRPFAAAFPNLQHIIQATNLGNSKYDGLQVSYRQRNWHGINTQSNFTWSKCFDDSSVNRGGSGETPQLNNPLNIQGNYGLCDEDVRLNFNVGGTYNFPSVKRLGRVGDGWQLNSLYTAISGRPFSVFIGSPDPSGQGLVGGGSIRADWDGTPVHYNTRNPNDYVVETYTAPGQADPCGNTDGGLGGLPLSPFYIPCTGTVGSSRRNQLIGPGLSQWDASLVKDAKITERIRAEFRWEVFNLLNRANFANSTFIGVGNNVASPSSFGHITSTPDVSAGNPVIGQGGPRNMDFVLKFIF